MPRPKRTRVQSATAKPSLTTQQQRSNSVLQPPAREQPNKRRRESPPEQPVICEGDSSDKNATDDRLLSQQRRKSENTSPKGRMLQARMSQATDSKGRAHGAERAAESQCANHPQYSKHGPADDPSNEATSEDQRTNELQKETARPSRHRPGRVPASSPQATLHLEGFEEFMLSSSPRPLYPASALRPQATPSFLSMSAFKRRPRQPSLLQMVQVQNEEQDEGPEDSDVEDSILRELEASSTQKLPSVGMRIPSSGSRKRKASDITGNEENVPPSSPPAPWDTASSEQDSQADEEIQVAATQSDEVRILEDDIDARQQTTGMRHSLQGTSLKNHTGNEQLAPHLLNDSPDRIPSSQSPQLVPKATTESYLPKIRPGGRPPLRQRAGKFTKPRHTPPTQRSRSPPLDATSPVSSPAFSPARLAKRPSPPLAERIPKVRVTRRKPDGRPVVTANDTRQQKREEHVTTEALRALLPRRRRNLRPQEDAFDLPSSSPGLDEHDDTSEVMPNIRKTRPMKPTTTNTNFTPISTNKAKGRLKTTRAAPIKPAAKGRTYGRRVPSGQENEDGPSAEQSGHSEDDAAPDDDTRFEDSTKSTETAAAVRKFREVDDWELSFESCDVNGGSSSPWR